MNDLLNIPAIETINDLTKVRVVLYMSGRLVHAPLTAIGQRGSWTPSIQFGGATTGITYSTQSGTYVRISDVVIASGTLVFTNKGTATGAATLAGLPFAVGTESAVLSVGRYTNFTGLAAPISGDATPGTTTIDLQDSSATSSTNLVDTNFTNTTELQFSLAYLMN